MLPLLFAFLIPFLTQAQTQMQATTPRAAAQIDHIAILVEDLNESLHFYQKVFGFPRLEDPFRDNVHAWLGIGHGLSLHLIEDSWTSPTIDKNNHLCFAVSDLKGFIDNLNSLEIHYEDWPGAKMSITPRPDGVQQIYLQDPNGYWIEVNDSLRP